MSSEDQASFSKFQHFLKDENFIDFFNKFASLPAFTQLVVYNKETQDFLLYPDLPKGQYVLNHKGLLAWLWQKRFYFFIRCRLYNEYHLACHLINYDLIKDDEDVMSQSDKESLQVALRWLLQKCFGRVSAMRRFRKFLQTTINGIKMYQFWMDSERLLLFSIPLDPFLRVCQEQIKRRSHVSVDLFLQLKEKYFSSSGIFRLPHHILEAAWKNVPEALGSASQEAGSFNIIFALYLQQVCLNRLTTYWLPRYVVDAKVQLQTPEESMYYSLALRYIRFRCIESSVLSDIASMLLTSSPRSSLLDERSRSLPIPGVDLNNMDELTNISTESTIVSEILRPESPETPRAVTPTDEGSRRGSPDKRLSVRFQSSPGNAKSQRGGEDDFGDDSDATDGPRGKSRRKRENTPSRMNFKSLLDLQPMAYGTGTNADDAEGNEKGAFHDDRHSSEFSLSSRESWEGVAGGGGEFRKDDKEKHYENMERHRQRSLAARKQRFEHLLQEAWNWRTSRPKIEKKRKPDQMIIDDIINEIELESPWGVVPSEQKEDTGVQSDEDDAEDIVRRPSVKSTRNVPQSLAITPQVPSSEELAANRESCESLLADENFEENQTSENLKATDMLGPASLGSPYSRKRQSSYRFSRRKVTTVTFRLSEKVPETEVQDDGSRGKKVKKMKKLSQPQSTGKRSKTSEKLIDGLSAQRNKPLSRIIQESCRPFTQHDDHQYRNKNQRMILAFQTDPAAAGPFRQFLKNTDNEDMADYLKFWQDVEYARSDFQFGDMSFDSLVESVTEIVNKYILPSSPNRIDFPVALCDDIISIVTSSEMREMPWQLRKLQMEVLEDLRGSYEAYTQQDVTTFYNAAAIKTSDTLMRTSTPPNPFARRTTKPICKTNMLSRKRIPPGVSLAPLLPSICELSEHTHHQLHAEELDMEMRLRMFRAQKLAIENHLPVCRVSLPPVDDDDDDVESVDSDDNGRVQRPPLPKLVRDPPLDTKKLAAHSVRQYPDPNHPFPNVTQLRIVHRNLMRPNTAYRPVKRGGTYVMRPTTRPGNFNEILRDHNHLEFFKRFLKAHHSEVPFLFVLSVEAMRGIHLAKERHNKAKAIVKKYFHNPKIPATELLLCDTKLVREIPYSDTVTVSMLFLAENEVVRMLRESWYHKYADSFSDSVFSAPVSSEIMVASEKGVNMKILSQVHLKNAWTVFSDFIRRAATFVRCMREKKFVDGFHTFLGRQSVKDDLDNPAYDTIQSDVITRRSQTFALVAPSQSTARGSARRSMMQRIINGQLVTFELLQNDLRFWREIECFKTMCDCQSVKKKHPSYSKEDSQWLRFKANLIIHCFLDSAIHPSVRVNVPSEVAEITCEAFSNGLIDRALFHEATIYIFPMLLSFWKKFCQEFYRYSPVPSKKHQNLYGMKITPRLAAVRKKQRQNLKEKKMAAAAVAASGDQMEVTEKDAHSTASVPDYLHLDIKSIKKRKGTPVMGGDDMCHLYFSLRRGVTIVEVARRRRFDIARFGSAGVRMRIGSNTSWNEDGKKALRKKSSTSSLRRPDSHRKSRVPDTAMMKQFLDLPQI